MMKSIIAAGMTAAMRSGARKRFEPINPMKYNAAATKGSSNGRSTTESRVAPRRIKYLSAHERRVNPRAMSGFMHSAMALSLASNAARLPVLLAN